MSEVIQDFYITLTESDFNFAHTLTPQLRLDKSKTWYMALTDYTLVNPPHVVFEKNEKLFETHYKDDIQGNITFTYRAKTPLIFKSQIDIIKYVEHETGGDFIFLYNRSTNKISVKKKKVTNECSLFCLERHLLFYPKLAGILGFLPFTFYGNKKVEAPFTFNIYGGFNNLYLYSPLIINSYVGDSLSPLLKIISLNRQKYINYNEYIHPTYFKLKNNTLSDIQIIIKDDFGGDIIKNTHAPTTLNITLHISTQQAI